MEQALDERRAVWTRYWSQGATHSCGGSFGSRYEGALAQFWRGAFATLAPGARVLDIATGNGALPQLLVDFDPQGQIACDAIDLATLAPAWFDALPPARRAQLRFHGQQAAEALPFADASVDMVISQYGLEYTDLARTVPELLRVCKPDGQVRLVCHHAEARPVQLAHTELAHLDWLTAPEGMLDTALGMIGPVARAATEQGRAALAQDTAAQAVRERFNTLQDALAAQAAGSNCPDVLVEVRQALATILNMAMRDGAASAQAALAALRAQLADAALRLAELRDYALDADAAAQLGRTLAGAEGTLALAPILEQDVLMGWAISVQRAAAHT
ncbi:class I SAM-dependent methyltransferase [Massilia sp. CF038]|uniref:class I SAM-dependent methyltransferase n=1 Tax=Massilia sp. CF038 TaxID=1881045 RepID=UPI00091150B9|nr:class I SAM-dependent methyltransferase [Massilia sp. CF038]SHH21716.1 Methyltransferase domain-containing protein [Massilia sp. CF038]